MADDKWNGQESVTITRDELADIVAFRLALEHTIIQNHLTNPLAAKIMEDIITNVCGSICALIFHDTTREKLAEELIEADDDLGGLEIDEGTK